MDPDTSATKLDGDLGFRWWRWFGVFWLALGVAGAAVRDWKAVGLAGLFLAGYLAQEVRALQREAPRAAGKKAALLSFLAALLGSGSVYLALRYTWSVTIPWWVVLVVFLALLVLYACGPTLARSARDRRDGRGPRTPGSWPP
jgi:Flp pilus assembly protein TadB